MNLFNFIKSQIQILPVINEYTTLKQAGIYWKGICPFHSEKTPSFTVSPHKEIYYCFGCHAGGDVISFIAKAENYSQFEAAKFLADRFSINVPKEINNEFKKSEIINAQKDHYFFICEKVSIWCNENLKKSTEASNYITERGFSKKIIDKFLIGYFPSGVNNIKQFIKAMLKESVLADDLIKANILMESKNNFYSPFEERIIFPITDQLGRFCGFGGRVFKEGDERAKYYNSHENNFFNKGSILYGLNLAKKSIQERDHVFLVEGYTDCIAMFQSNYTNCVATLGTACTLEHLKLISRFASKIYILYDGDEAGKRAILRLTEMCWNVNLEPMVISLLNGEDPASFLNKNGKLQELIICAKDIYSFFIDSSSYNFSKKNLNEKINIVKKITDVIYKIEDQLKKNILLQEIAIKLNIPVESLKKNYENRAFDDKTNINIKIDEISDLKISDLEKNIFAIIMNNFDLLTPEYYYLADFFCDINKNILLKLIELKSQFNDNKKIAFDDLYDNLHEKEKLHLNKNLLSINSNLPLDFKNMIMQFQKKNWKNINQVIKLKLIQAQKNSDLLTVNKIISEFDILKKKIINGGCND